MDFLKMSNKTLDENLTYQLRNKLKYELGNQLWRQILLILEIKMDEQLAYELEQQICVQLLEQMKRTLKNEF